MIHGEQALFSVADYYNGSLLPVSVDETTDLMEDPCCYGDMIVAPSGFSEVQMGATCNVNESAQTDASADHHIPLMTEPLVDLLELKNYRNSNERSGLTFCWPEECSGIGGHDSVLLSHCAPKEETVSSETYMKMEWQQAESAIFPVQALNTNKTPELKSHLKGEADASHVTPTSTTSLSRKLRGRSRENESRRRSIVSQRVQDLQELLPPSTKDKRNIQESTVQDAIGHIKYLQLQLKELSRSRLGGDSIAGSLKFVEGYGHYHPQGEMLDEPLEDIIGRLVEENPAAAHELLEKKGFYMLPMASAALLCNNG